MKERKFCQSCGEFIGEFVPGTEIPCPHCASNQTQPVAPQGTFTLDSLDYDRLTSLSFELFKVIDPRPAVGELKNMGDYTGIYEKVFGRKIKCNNHSVAKEFIYSSLDMVSIWIHDNCQEFAVPVKVKITPGYGVENGKES